MEPGLIEQVSVSLVDAVKQNAELHHESVAQIAEALQLSTDEVDRAIYWVCVATCEVPSKISVAVRLFLGGVPPMQPRQEKAEQEA